MPFTHADLAKEHIRVSYSYEDGAFELMALGKTGLTVNGEFIPKNTKIFLEKSSTICVGSFNGQIKIF